MPRRMTVENSETGERVSFDWHTSGEPTKEDLDKIFSDNRARMKSAVTGETERQLKLHPPTFAERHPSLESARDFLQSHAETLGIDPSIAFDPSKWKVGEPDKRSLGERLKVAFTSPEGLMEGAKSVFPILQSPGMLKGMYEAGKGAIEDIGAEKYASAAGRGLGLVEQTAPFLPQAHVPLFGGAKVRPPGGALVTIPKEAPKAAPPIVRPPEAPPVVHQAEFVEPRQQIPQRPIPEAEIVPPERAGARQLLPPVQPPTGAPEMRGIEQRPTMSVGPPQAPRGLLGAPPTELGTVKGPQAPMGGPSVELIHANIGMDGTGRVGIVGDDVSTEEFKRAFLPSLPEGWRVDVSKPRSPLMEAYTPGRQNFNVDFFDEQGRKVTPPKEIFEPQKTLGEAPKVPPKGEPQ